MKRVPEKKPRKELSRLFHEPGAVPSLSRPRYRRRAGRVHATALVLPASKRLFIPVKCHKSAFPSQKAFFPGGEQHFS